MSSRLLTPLTLTFALAAPAAQAAPRESGCPPVRRGAAVDGFSAEWRAAVAALVASTAEPGHPWSCSGGSIELVRDGDRVLLRVSREGEAPVMRSVASPDDIVPLGQALLASPLAPSQTNAAVVVGPAETPVSEPPIGTGATGATGAPDPPSPEGRAPLLQQSATTASSPRILLGAGIDARWVAGPGVPSVGPALQAGVPIDRWLPAVVLRHQSALSKRPHFGEISAAVSVQRRFVWSALELRAGVFVRAASVQRDVPGTRGEQSRIDARAGVSGAVVVPVRPWLRVVVSADGEIVGPARERSEDAPPGEEPPRPFPTQTLGGCVGLEVPL